MNLQNNEIKKLAVTIEEFIAEKTCSALSILLNEPIQHNLTILGSRYNSKNKILFSSDEIKMCSVRLNGKGDIHIELLYTIKLNHAINIASKLLGMKINKLDEMGMSALQEVANILTGSFFNALSENTGFQIDLSTPEFKEGELQELIKEPANDVKSCINDVVITDVSLWGNNTKTEIHMIIIQHPEHARKLISFKEENVKQTKYEETSNANLLGGEHRDIDELVKNCDSSNIRFDENSKNQHLKEGTFGDN